MQRSRTLATVLAVLLLAATPAFPQVIGAGNMDGRMVDATGAVLPGVTVTAQNLDTGLTRTAITESSGRFTFLSLPVGPYTLTAELSGFQTLKREGLVMTVGTLQSLGDMTIEVATVEEIITVTAESPLIETSRPVVATTFNERAIENLPIQGRDFKNFALNTPNVVGPDPNSGRTTISMGGMKGIDTNITVDGADFNNTFFGSATGQPEVPFFVVSQEAVQEFQVLANGFSAEFGRSGGGFLNVVTKSGTNEFHGSGFYFGRGDWGRGTVQDGTGQDLDNSQFSQQQFGGSVGGPIARDRTTARRRSYEPRRGTARSGKPDRGPSSLRRRARARAVGRDSRAGAHGSARGRTGESPDRYVGRCPSPLQTRSRARPTKRRRDELARPRL